MAPMGAIGKNNLNPTTFLSQKEDRKCEKLWTLPNGIADNNSALLQIARSGGIDQHKL